MPGQYALKTEVSYEQTRIDIERLLRRYGAEQFLSGESNNAALVGFRMHGRLYRIQVPLPDPDSEEFTVMRAGSAPPRERPRRARDRLYEQTIKTRWRALLLVVRAKLEAVDVGIYSFEEAFMGETLMRTGETVGEWAGPQVEHMYATGEMPTSLPGFRQEQQPMLTTNGGTNR